MTRAFESSFFQQACARSVLLAYRVSRQLGNNPSIHCTVCHTTSADGSTPHQRMPPATHTSRQHPPTLLPATRSAAMPAARLGSPLPRRYRRRATLLQSELESGPSWQPAARAITETPNLQQRKRACWHTLNARLALLRRGHSLPCTQRARTACDSHLIHHHHRFP